MPPIEDSEDPYRRLFWIGHHLIFWSIERSNRILMWLNLLFLFPIVCLPAATALVGEYPKNGTTGTRLLVD